MLLDAFFYNINYASSILTRGNGRYVGYRPFTKRRFWVLPELQYLLDQFRPDEVVVVCKLDRLARSTH